MNQSKVTENPKTNTQQTQLNFSQFGRYNTQFNKQPLLPPHAGVLIFHKITFADKQSLANETQFVYIQQIFRGWRHKGTGENSGANRMTNQLTVDPTTRWQKLSRKNYTGKNLGAGWWKRIQSGGGGVRWSRGRKEHSFESGDAVAVCRTKVHLKTLYLLII